MTAVVRYHRLISAKVFMSDTELLNFFIQKIIQWLSFSYAWLTQRLVVSGIEKLFDLKESVSPHCFTKCPTSKNRINAPVISICKPNAVAWKKKLVLWNSSVSPKLVWTAAYSCLYWHINWSHKEVTQWEERLLSQTKLTSSIQQALGSLQRLPVFCICCFWHFTFILDFLAFCFCFFAGGGST